MKFATRGPASLVKLGEGGEHLFKNSKAKLVEVPLVTLDVS